MEKVRAAFGPEYPELVLDADHLDVGIIDELGGGVVIPPLLLLDLELHFLRIEPMSDVVAVHSQYAYPAAASGKGIQKTVAQIMGESGYPALSGRIRAHKRYLHGFGIFCYVSLYSQF